MGEHHKPLSAKRHAVQVGVFDVVEHDTDVTLVVRSPVMVAESPTPTTRLTLWMARGECLSTGTTLYGPMAHHQAPGVVVARS